MAPRGRGGKFSKPSRGGGKHFSRDLQPVDKNGNPVSLWREKDDIASSSGEEEEESSSSEEEESSSDEIAVSGATTSGAPALTREERRAAAKAKKLAAIARRNQSAAQPGDLPPSDSEESEDDEEDDLPANPNHSAKSRSQLNKVVPEEKPKATTAPKDLSQLSRREREAIQAQQARERYLKLHAEGKTEEARADLARLAIIREQREVERLRKEAEKEEREERAKEQAEARERENRMREAARGGAKKKGKK